MAKKINIRIVTPTRSLIDEPVDMVIMRGIEGDLGILPGHEPLTTVLAIGSIKLINEGEERIATILGGFAEVGAEKITILSDAAEWPNEIDVHRAEEAKERALTRIQQRPEGCDISRAELALRRSLVRLDVSTYTIIKGNK